MSPTTDRLTGISTTTTAQPSTGGARQAQDTAPASPVRGGGQTSRPAGSPSHLQGGTPSSPRDRVRAAAGTEAGSGSGGGIRDAAESPLPAGTSRTFTIKMPAGLKLLSLNQRLHWAEKNRRAQALKKAAWAMALSAKLPHLERVSVVVEYQPPDRRHRDGDNISPSGKHALDGIVAAGVLSGDDKRYVTGTYCTIGDTTYPGGRIVLHLTEVAEIGGAA